MAYSAFDIAALRPEAWNVAAAARAIGLRDAGRSRRRARLHRPARKRRHDRLALPRRRPADGGDSAGRHRSLLDHRSPLDHQTRVDHRRSLHACCRRIPDWLAGVAGEPRAEPVEPVERRAAGEPPLVHAAQRALDGPGQVGWAAPPPASDGAWAPAGAIVATDISIASPKDITRLIRWVVLAAMKLSIRSEPSQVDSTNTTSGKAMTTW